MLPSSSLLRIARRYIWWSAPEETVSKNLPRLVAQVMELGTWEDSHELLGLLGREAFVDVLRHPPPGVFSPKSWSFWHYRLGLGAPPEYPRGRIIPQNTGAER
ncbi:MAG TPA: hypothetical protein VGL35_02040 [Rhizomicrobium sp.]|jgi:hypothetical protein